MTMIMVIDGDDHMVFRVAYIIDMNFLPVQGDAF